MKSLSLAAFLFSTVCATAQVAAPAWNPPAAPPTPVKAPTMPQNVNHGAPLSDSFTKSAWRALYATDRSSTVDKAGSLIDDAKIEASTPAERSFVKDLDSYYYALMHIWNTERSNVKAKIHIEGWAARTTPAQELSAYYTDPRKLAIDKQQRTCASKLEEVLNLKAYPGKIEECYQD